MSLENNPMAGWLSLRGLGFESAAYFCKLLFDALPTCLIGEFMSGKLPNDHFERKPLQAANSYSSAARPVLIVTEANTFPETGNVTTS